MSNDDTLVEGMIVQIIGGPWRGHKGLITGLPEHVPGMAWVAIERESPPGMRGGSRGTVTTFSSYAVARHDLEPYQQTTPEE